MVKALENGDAPLSYKAYCLDLGGRDRFKLSVATPNPTIQKHVYAKHSYLLNCRSPTIKDSLEIPIQCSAYCKHSKNFLLTGLKRKLSPTMYLHHCSNFPSLPPPFF